MRATTVAQGQRHECDGEGPTRWNRRSGGEPGETDEMSEDTSSLILHSERPPEGHRDAMTTVNVTAVQNTSEGDLLTSEGAFRVARVRNSSLAEDRTLAEIFGRAA